MTDSKKKKTEKPITRDMMSMDNEKLLDYIQNQKFGSIEEINDFIKSNVIGKKIDEIIPTKKENLSDREKSDELIYKAYNSNEADGIRLANEALKIDPSNVRVLNFLAEHSKKVEDAFQIYKKAVDFGKEQLGANYFIENTGHFWLMIDSRPFMTAKLGYADCLGAMGRINESIKEYQEMLVLNPGDNQGIRYILGSKLLQSKRYTEYLALHQQFDDENSAGWLYNYALCLFITGGASPKANKALQNAYKCNKHVLKIFTGKEKAKDAMPGYYSPGDVNEATDYLMGNFNLWNSYPQSFSWLFQFSATLKR